MANQYLGTLRAFASATIASAISCKPARLWSVTRGCASRGSIAPPPTSFHLEWNKLTSILSAQSLEAERDYERDLRA